MNEMMNEARSDWSVEHPTMLDDAMRRGFDPTAAPLTLPPFTGCRACEAGCFDCTPPF